MDADDRERRQHPRRTKRMTCEIAQPDGRASTGVVCDVSAGGLFVQTGVRPELDSVVEVVLPDPLGKGDLRFEAGVARKRHVRGELATSVRDGLGLEILPLRSPIGHRLLATDRPSLGRAEDLPPVAEGGFRRTAASRDAGVRAYRFCVKRHDRPETRIVTVRCVTLACARAQALARVGAGWKITRVERL